MSLVMTPSLHALPWWQTARSRLQGRWRTALQARHVYVQAPADEGPMLDAVKTDFAAWCAAHAGERCHLALSSRCLLTCVSEPGQDAEAARQQAMQQWAHYLDLDAQVLSAHWFLRQVQHAGANLVCAAPRALVAALQSLAHDHGVRIEAMVPWWVDGVQAWLTTLPPVAGDADEVAHLQLLEPGLITHVQAARPVGQSARLQRVWVEVRDGASTETAGSHHVALPMPSVALDGSALTLRHIWDHTELQAVLTGQAVAWQVSP